MPTQAQLDKEQDRTQSQSGTIGTVRRGGTQAQQDKQNEVSKAQQQETRRAKIHDVDTQPRTDDNKEGTNERIQNDGIDRITNPLGDTSGGGGLPEGYEETDFIMCVNGEPVEGQILFKEDA